jgi:hypothetical protein
MGLCQVKRLLQKNKNNYWRERQRTEEDERKHHLPEPMGHSKGSPKRKV